MKTTVVLWTAAWTAGYGAALAFPGIYVPFYVVLLPAILLGALSFVSFRGKTAAGLALLILLAFGYYQWFDHRNATGMLPPGMQAESLNESEAVVEGVLDSVVEVDGDKASFVLLTLKSALNGEAGMAVREKLQVTVKLTAEEEQKLLAGLRRGDRVQAAGTLRLPEPARNFGGFDYRGYLRLQHIHWLLSVKGAASLKAAAPQAWSSSRLLSLIDRTRDYLGSKLDLLFPPDQAGYMKGLLIGLRADIDPLEFQQFSQLGLTHLLAISGLHVAVFVAALLWLLGRAGCTRESAMLTAIAVMPLYILLTGASPSVIRAGLMAMLALYAAYKHLLKDGLHLLCAVEAAHAGVEPVLHPRCGVPIILPRNGRPHCGSSRRNEAFAFPILNRTRHTRGNAGLAARLFSAVDLLFQSVFARFLAGQPGDGTACQFRRNAHRLHRHADCPRQPAGRLMAGLVHGMDQPAVLCNRRSDRRLVAFSPYLAVTSGMVDCSLLRAVRTYTRGAASPQKEQGGCG